MNEARIAESPSWSDPRREAMKTPDDVEEMLRLKACGWGVKRIAAELGCSHHTVKHYVAAGGVVPFKSPQRAKALDGHEDWLRERFIRHRGKIRIPSLQGALNLMLTVCNEGDAADDEYDPCKPTCGNLIAEEPPACDRRQSEPKPDEGIGL